jgi:hypothetical protein
MIQKHPICPQRIRRIPSQFSWVDHRLVRERYIESCSHPAAALYLFLVTVADCHGLSYYSDASVMTRLAMDALTLDEARRNLIASGLIAFKSPLYQVFSLDPIPDHRAPLDRPVSIGQLFKQMRGGAL